MLSTEGGGALSTSKFEITGPEDQDGGDGKTKFEVAVRRESIFEYTLNSRLLLLVYSPLSFFCFPHNKHSHPSSYSHTLTTFRATTRHVVVRGVHRGSSRYSSKVRIQGSSTTCPTSDPSLSRYKHAIHLVERHPGHLFQRQLSPDLCRESHVHDRQTRRTVRSRPSPLFQISKMISR